MEPLLGKTSIRRHLLATLSTATALLLLLTFLTLISPCSAEQSPPIMPDPKLTPGAVLPVTVADISVPGYTKRVRDVPQSLREQVFAEYGISHHAPREYEIDHLIPLELGGSNSIKNLWAESYVTQPWNAHVKDRLENKLHRLVCSGQLDLATAQHTIATDWISVYKKYVSSETPHPTARQPRTIAPHHRHHRARPDRHNRHNRCG